MIIQHAKTQLVFFSPEIHLANKLKLAYALNEQLSNLLDSDPVILPIPDDAPPEIPVIQMFSSDQRYTLMISKNRIDLHYNSELGKDERILPIPGLLEKMRTIHEYITREKIAQIVRCAIVTNFIVELDTESAAQFIMTKYVVQKAPCSTLNKEAHLHFLSTVSIAGYEANQWLRLQSARRISQPDSDSCFVIQLDLNTLQDKEYEFDSAKIFTFLQESCNIINELIQKHITYWGT